MNKSYLSIFLLLAIIYSACGDETPDTPDTPDTPIIDCADAIAEENFGNFDWIQKHIFTPSCAASESCHVNTQNMDLRKGMAFDELVDVAPTSNSIRYTFKTMADNLQNQDPNHEPPRGDVLRVTPGNPEKSLLMIIVDHESQGGRFSGDLPLIGTMPIDEDILCLEKRQTIEQWIKSLDSHTD